MLATGGGEVPEWVSLSARGGDGGRGGWGDDGADGDLALVFAVEGVDVEGGVDGFPWCAPASSGMTYTTICVRRAPLRIPAHVVLLDGQHGECRHAYSSTLGEEVGYVRVRVRYLIPVPWSPIAARRAAIWHYGTFRGVHLTGRWLSDIFRHRLGDRR